MDQVIDCLEALISLTDIEGVYLIDSFQYNTACFIGRESEIDKMHSILKNSQLLFVSGIGGIGKTELVKRYANRYRNLYDTIVFTVFDKNIVSLVNDEILMVEYAKLFNEYPYEWIKEAEKYCEKAQELCLEYGLQDEYLQSLLYETKAEILSNDNDYDSDQVLELKKKCDYSVLAEHQLQKAADEENKIKIWKDAADSYRYVDYYEMQIECLQKSLSIVTPILNQYEFSKFNGDYWNMMGDLIQAYIQIREFKKANSEIDVLYQNAIEFYGNIENFEDAWNRIWDMWSVAGVYVESASKENAVNTYLAALYMGLEKDSKQYKILKDRDSNSNMDKIGQAISGLLDGTIEDNIVDWIIDIKNELVNYYDDYRGDKNIYNEIVLKINERYQNQEIEFKK